MEHVHEKRPGGAGRPERKLLLVGVLALSFAAQHLALRQLPADGPVGGLRMGLFLVSAAALVGLAVQFRRFAGAWLIAAGIALNFVPMAANDAMMPTSYEVVHASNAFPEITTAQVGEQLGRHTVLFRDDIRFYFLADRYYREFPVLGRNIFSVGDAVELAGLVLVVVQGMAMLVLAAMPRRRPGARTVDV